ncbi:MAG: helix-turn-helix domain-containing protein [Nostochopsis sp.]
MMIRQWLNGRKILLIESQSETQNFVKKCLQAEGVYIIIAENGFMGVQQAREKLPDLILSEISVSQIDGYSILSTLRQNLATAIIPLIFVSSKDTRGDIRKGMELGADDFLTKPFTVEELLGAIAGCLHKRAILEQWYATQYQARAKLPLLDAIEECETCIDSMDKCQTCTEHAVKLSNFESLFSSDPLLKEVFRFIETNYHQQITLSDVAVAVGYSSTYLTNLVRRQTGQTVQNWIIERRMVAARTLLLETDKTVEAIAASIGYQAVSHFFRQFRQHHSSTPQVWRKEHRSILHNSNH